MLGHQPSFKHYLYVAVSNIVTLVFVAVGTFLIVALAQGYRYDVASGEVSLSGLLRVESNPITAEVFIDGESTNERTSYKETIDEGLHSVELRADGYRTWQKDVQIRGGLVEWLRYPRLLPQELKQEAVLAQKISQELTFGPNGRYALRGSAPQLEVLDLTNSSSAPRKVTVPGGEESQLSSVLWSDSASSALLTIKNNTTNQYYVLNASNGELINITEALENFTPLALMEDVVLAKRATNDLWVVDYNSAESTVRPLSASVSVYANDQHSVVWQDENGMFIWDGEQNIEVETIDDFIAQELDIFTFEGEIYVAGVSKDRGIVVANALNTQSVRGFTSATGLIGASKNGQFITFETKTGYTTYDLDRSRNFQFEFDSPVVDIYWADGFSLFGTQAGKLVLFEFDGANLQAITDKEEAAEAIISDSGRSLYTVSRNSEASVEVLSQISLIVQDN